MNKVVLITGGARGIGSAIALELAKNGYDIVINYLTSKQPAKELKEKIYVFVSIRKGYELRIPNDGCIIGRTELGANELADNPAVSKKHIVVTVNKKFGLFIEDISSFGTSVNGKQVLKNDKVHISNGDEITLYNEKFIVKEI